MYSDLICNHFTNPSYIGDMESPDYEFVVGNQVCGDRIAVKLKTDSGVVSDIVYRAWGCATSVATGDIFCGSVKGVDIGKIIARNSDTFAQMLGELEPSQQHCVKIMEELHHNLINVLNVREV